MIGENLAGGPADVADLMDWANFFGLNHPVVSDPNWSESFPFTGSSISLPEMHQLAAGALLLREGTRVNEGQVVDALP